MKEELSVIIIIMCIVLATGLIALAMWGIKSNKQAFIDMCASDNHSKFECEYMYRSKDHATVVPVPVVVGR